MHGIPTPATNESPSPLVDGLPPATDCPPQISPQAVTTCAHIGPRASASSRPQSPSLNAWKSGTFPAYELKVVLSEATAHAVEASLRERLEGDAHGDPALQGAYRVATLYTDNSAFDVYHRLGRISRSKFRLRRYGAGEVAFLERKTRRGDRVRKQRVEVPLGELECLQAADSGGEWAGLPFRVRLRQRDLHPVCLISYVRQAYFGENEYGPFRLTFDRHLAGSLATDWSFVHAAPEQPLECPGVICEFKFRGPVPGEFKRLMEQFEMLPGGFSKYRTCVQTLGLAPRKQADV